MSDIAPFVASAIRDKVVDDLREENKGLRNDNERLKRLLHERHPVRSVQLITYSNCNEKEIIVDCKVHIPSLPEEDEGDMPSNIFLFPSNGVSSSIRSGYQLSQLIEKFEIWIDGACAISFRDFKFFFLGFGNVHIETGTSSLEHFLWTPIGTSSLDARFRVEDEGSNILGDLAVACDEQSRRELSTFVTQQEINKEFLLSVCGRSEAWFNHHLVTCKRHWFDSKLAVPYTALDEDSDCFSEDRY